MKSLLTNRMLAFLFALFMGISGVLGAFWFHREKAPPDLYPFVIASLFGSVVGVGVFLAERSRYIHLYKSEGAIDYQTSSLWKIVSLIQLVFALGVSGEMASYIILAWGSYFLTLSFVLFRLRQNTNIVIR